MNAMLEFWANIKMFPDLIWAPDFVGPQKYGPPEIWSLKKFGPYMKIIIWHFYAKTNFLGAHISQGPNFSGTKKMRGDHFSTKVLFTNDYTWQNFGLRFLGLVNRLYTVIHKTQKS